MLLLTEALTALLLFAAPSPDDSAITHLLSTEKIAAVHRQISAHPHVAGTVGGRAQADLIAQILRGTGVKVETHSYWAMLSYPRRMTLRLFPNHAAAQGVNLALNERADQRDPDTAAIDLLPGFIAYSATARVRAAVIDAGMGRPADYDAGINVKDKIALVRLGGALIAEKAREAEIRGAAGVVFFDAPATARTKVPAVAWPIGTARASWFVERGASTRDPAPPRIPLIVVSWQVAEQLLPRPKLRVATQQELEIETHMNDSPRPIFNIIATIEGSEDSGRAIMLGAHHDAWTTGAVDPGEPVTALLELARVFTAMTKSGWKPRHTIQLAFWDAGEYGNAGASQHALEFAPDLAQKIIAYVNCDLTPQGAAAVEEPFPPAPSPELDFGARHSIYDTNSYMTKFDPGFRKTRAAAETFGHTALRLAAMDAPPPKLAPLPPPKEEPARGEIDYAEKRLAQLKEAYDAGAIAKNMLDAAQKDLDDARERYDRLRENSGKLTPAIAAEEVKKAEARSIEAKAKAHYLEEMNSTGVVARRDLEQAREAAKQSEEYLALARTRQEELAHEWELLQKVKEWEERGGKFDDSVFEQIGTAFEKQWGHALPVSALGMTHTHEVMNFDHTGRVDVALSPDSPEGAWLVEQLTLHDVPFLVFRGAVPGKATGAHIHLGLPSPRLRR